MEEGSDFRNWGELIPDTLGLIFKNLVLKEKLTVIPSVCKSWAKAVNGPYCWQEIDIEEWSTYCRPQLVDRMLRMLITRSCGSVRKLCVSGVGNDQAFSFIADQFATSSLGGSKLYSHQNFDELVTSLLSDLWDNPSS